MKITLEFDSLEKSFGLHRVLSSVYMKCEVGEVIGLLGRNGSGKSTLMQIVFGSLYADHKSVRVNGESISTGNYMAKQAISYLPQGNLIPLYLTIREAFALFRISTGEVTQQFPDVNKYLDYKPREISGGYLRIIETLLVLKSKANFCILDEPFSGLMPLHIEKLRTVIHQAKAHKGIIITDHLFRQVTSLSDRLYLLNHGKTYPIQNEEQLIDFGYTNAL
jgi:ABC-type multidrug transport system ATPase subunit